MYGFITDREQSNVLRLNKLSAKGFANMSAEERKEWLGDPVDAEGVNLLPLGPYISSAVTLEYTHDAIIATATKAGTYLYAVSIIGNAADYEGKTITLSAEYVGGQIGIYWYDGNGYEYAGVLLTSGGKVTATLTKNTANRTQLAMFIHVTTSVEVPAGAKARFSKVMLENGSKQHEYVPYTEIVPTESTKGAYNYSDLNRVERAVAYISQTLELNLLTKTDWKVWDIPKQSDMERYLNNIKVIKNTLHIEIDVPESMSGFNYIGANNIEKILVHSYQRIAVMKRSGELYSGEV